jgi:hypothetical protein
MNKAELIARLNQDQQALMEAISELPEEAMLEPGVNGEWSVKDIVAHICAWEAELVKLLWQARQGKRPTTIHFSEDRDIDQTNLNWYQERKDRPLERVLEDAQAVRKQTLRRVAEFTDEELNDPQAFKWSRGYPLWEWIANDSFGHGPEHIAQIRAWRQTRGL